MTEPLPDPPAPDEAPQPPAPAANARPDWLVGAEDGVAAEFERRDANVRPTPALKLTRPTAEPENAAAAPPRAPAPPAPRTQEATLDLGDAAPEAQPAAESLRLATRNAPPAPEKKKAWSGASSSVPTLKLVKPAAPPPPPPARTAAPAEPDETALDFPDAGSKFDATVIVPPPNAAGAAGAPARPLPPRVAPPREAWWVVALDELRANRRVQILAGLLALLLIGVLVVWPRSEMGTPVRQILQHGSQFDGRHVKVSGRVGEVFAVGGGYAFYLHQGRDTLVVFTRSRVPHERDHVAVSGQISTGFLDGQPRLALFETP